MARPPELPRPAQPLMARIIIRGVGIIRIRPADGTREVRRFCSRLRAMAANLAALV
jgi:hypothetical protein